MDSVDVKRSRETEIWRGGTAGQKRRQFLLQRGTLGERLWRSDYLESV